ncbi:MAG: hypothetical protein ACOWWO_20220, partial [Peptococcaceae bacterium]
WQVDLTAPALFAQGLGRGENKIILSILHYLNKNFYKEKKVKNKIFGVLLALTLALTGTIGMAANTVAANDDATIPFDEPVTYLGTNLGFFRQIVYWEWDYTYVIDWDLSYSVLQGAQGSYRSLFLGQNQSSQNYANRVECTSDAVFGIYAYSDTTYEHRLDMVVINIETVHYADGSYMRIT